MNNRQSYILLLFLSLSFCGCLSLKEVNQYATASITSLSRMGEINYNYSEYCRKDCELRQVRIGDADTSYNCICVEQAAKADSTIYIIHTTIAGYLGAIEQLSNNKNFKYDFSGLSASLQQNPLLNLSQQQASIVNKAGNALAVAATYYYRKNEMKKYLEKADTLFADLMDTYIFLLDNRLRKQLRTEYEIRLTNTQQMLENSVNNKALKQFIVKQFLDDKKYYDQHCSYLDCYVLLLRKVKDGHHQLFLQRNHLNDKSVKDLAMRYVAEIKDISATVQH